MTNSTTTAQTTDTAETFAAEIVECWTSQAATGELMIIGTADEMGVFADFEHVPEGLWDEVEALVREGFEEHNAGVTAAWAAEFVDAAERASYATAMSLLEDLGDVEVSYDWAEEHEAEIAALKSRGADIDTSDTDSVTIRAAEAL